MYKEIILSLLLVFTFHLHTEPKPLLQIKDIVTEEFGISPAAFTNYVFRRFYFIRRLENAIEVLFQYNKNRASNFTPDNHHLYTGQRARGRSLRPLFMVWGDFISYKDLLDQVLVEDFTKEVFVVSSSYFDAYEVDNPSLNYSAVENFILRSSKETNQDDETSSLVLFEGESPLQEEVSLDEITRVADLAPFICVDEVVERFYHIQRTKQAFQALRKLESVGLVRIPSSYHREENFLSYAGQQYHDATVITTIQLLCTKGNILPLTSLWASLSRYKLVRNREVMQEFSVLLVTLLKLSAANLKGEEEQDLDQEYVLKDMTGGLENMPLEEVLDILDILVDELPQFLEKYEFDSDLTWRTWGKKYGIVASVAAIALGIRIYLTYKTGDAPVPHSSELPIPPKGD